MSASRVSKPEKPGKPSRPSKPKAKRAQIVVACDACRKAKTKCSGTRPICSTCQDRSLECSYSADPDANPIIALKRKYTALNEAYNTQGRELALLQSRVVPGPSNAPLETHVKNTGYVPSTLAHGSDIDKHQGRELVLLQSPRVVPGPSNESPETHTQNAGHLPSAMAHSSDSENSQLSLATRDAHRSASPVHRRFSPGREVDHTGQGQAAEILRALTFMSDQDSIILLSRLRLGESWSSVAGSLPSYQFAIDDSVQRIDAYTRHGALPNLTPSAELSHMLGAESTADQFLTEQFMDSLTESASAPLKPWLIKAFDRDYFRQVCHMYYTSRSQMLPLSPGSQASFGNMSFSSAIYANHHTEQIQDTQRHNYNVPVWAQRILHVTMMQVDPFHDIMTELRSHIASGIAVEDVCGPHAYFAALDDEDTFHRAPLLSQIVARTVISLKPSESRKTTFTQYAVMYKYWTYWRWLLNPTRDNYSEIPEYIKPTAPLLFVAHPALFDLIVPPALRDLMVQQDNPNVEWFTEAAITVTCHWQGGSEATLYRDVFTNELDFKPICKTHVSSLDNWTMGKSVKSFLPKSYEAAASSMLQ